MVCSRVFSLSKFKSGSDEVVSPEIFPWGFEFCQKSMQWLPVQKNGTLFHTEKQNSENVKDYCVEEI